MTDSRFIPPQPDPRTEAKIAQAVTTALMSSTRKELTYPQLLRSVRLAYPGASARTVSVVLGQLIASHRLQAVSVQLPFGRRSDMERYAEVMAEAQERLL